MLKSEISISRIELLVREIAMMLIISIACLSIGFGFGLYLCKDKFQDGANYAIKELYANREKIR